LYYSEIKTEVQRYEENRLMANAWQYWTLNWFSEYEAKYNTEQKCLSLPQIV